VSNILDLSTCTATIHSKQFIVNSGRLRDKMKTKRLKPIRLIFANSIVLLKFYA